MTNAELRKMLIEEIKRQGKPFGLLIDDIAGGFTFTGRGQPQAFQVQPLVVYKVYRRRPARRTGSRRGHRGHAAGFAHENHGDRRHDGSLQRLLRRGIGFRAGFRLGSGHADFRNGSAEERNFHRQAADLAAAGA